MSDLHGLDYGSYGKYHELMTAYYITGKWPERPKTRKCYNGKNIRSAVDVYEAERLTKEMVRDYCLNKDQLFYLNHKAKGAARNIVEHILLQPSSVYIDRVFWTSNPLDMLHLMGPDNRNASDIVVKYWEHDAARPGKLRSRMVGISLKSHYKKKPASTTLNPGINFMDSMFGVDTSVVRARWSMSVRNNTIKHGIGTAKVPVKKLHELEKQVPVLLESNNMITIRTCQKIADMYRDAAQQLNQDTHVEILRTLMNCESSKINKIVVRSFGEYDFDHEIYKPNEDLDKIVDLHYGHLSLAGDTRSIRITGRDDINIACIGVKGKTTGGWTEICGRAEGIYKQAFINKR